MKNKWMLLLVAMLPLTLLMPGCSDSETAASAGIMQSVAELKGKGAIWDSYGARITALETKPAPTAGTPAGDITALTNKTNDLQAQITQVKAENTNLKATVDALSTKVNQLTPGVGGGNPTSSIGTVQFTNNPVAIPQIFSSSTGGSSSPWIMTIVNQSTTWQYVKPSVELGIASGQPATIVSDVTVLVSGGSCTLTGSLSAPGNMSFSPTNMNTTATTSMVIIPASGCNGSGEIQIGPGQSAALNIQVQNLKTPNPILWNVTTRISSRSM